MFPWSLTLDPSLTGVEGGGSIIGVFLGQVAAVPSLVTALSGKAAECDGGTHWLQISLESNLREEQAGRGETNHTGTREGRNRQRPRPWVARCSPWTPSVHCGKQLLKVVFTIRL